MFKEIRMDTLVLNTTTTKPKLAFAGTGWIGLNRMKSLLQREICEAVAILDPIAENAEKARQLAPNANIHTSFDDLLSEKPDGIVIATPSALHASQSIAALERGVAVFCQKPLARSADESRMVIDAARANNMLLGVDLSYRFTDGMQKIYTLSREKELGKIYAVDLEFHNAYGPDKPWFYNPKLSGGGCLIDLGIHLVDLAMWVLDFPEVDSVTSSLFSKGNLIYDASEISEDFVSAQMMTKDGTMIRISCSWHLPAGKDAEIKAAFYGSSASAIFANKDGSFYDFETRLNHGTSSQIISSPPDEWGGRALIDWSNRLAQSRDFDPEIEKYEQVAQVVDRIYGR
jgi:predicted dehydrogenase